MKQVIRLTESKLRSLIESCVTEALKESGDTDPTGAGKYALARRCSRLASLRGKYNQSANFSQYGEEAFNDQYGFKNDHPKTGEPTEFGMYGTKPYYKMGDIGDNSKRDLSVKQEQDRYGLNIPNQRAYMRNRSIQGIDAYNKVKDAELNIAKDYFSKNNTQQ